MARKKPWCQRAKSRQGTETVRIKHVWSHAPRMFWGGMVQLLVFSGAVGLHASMLLLVVRDVPNASGFSDLLDFLTIALQIWGAGMGILSLAFLFSLAITLPGKQRMKRLLLPIRCHRCPKCFYDLSQRPRGDDVCPECGIVAPRRECVRLWCQLLRSRF